MDSDEEDSAEEDDEGASPTGAADAGIFDDDIAGFEGLFKFSSLSIQLILGIWKTGTPEFGRADRPEFPVLFLVYCYDPKIRYPNIGFFLKLDFFCPVII